MANHSNILAWRIPRTEEPGGLYSPWDLKESDKTEVTQHQLAGSDGGKSTFPDPFLTRGGDVYS